MTSAVESDFSSYVQEIQDKISIALAIAVVRSKPENIPIQEYVGKLQMGFLKEWQKAKTVDVFEEKLVSMQLQKVAEHVAEVLPDSPTVEDDDSRITSGSSNNMAEDPQLPLPFPDSLAIEHHGLLFKSLVQLKFATETKKTVLFDRVREFIECAKECSGNAERTSHSGGLTSPKKSPVSEDSGVATSAGHTSGRPDAVSTSLFKSITHSGDTEALILKTAGTLLNYVEFAVFHSPFDSYYNWEGSLLEKTCNILAGAVTDAQFRASLNAFLETSLDRIWTSDDTLMSFATEYQLSILSTLCHISEVCSCALNNIMLKCEEFVSEFSGGEPPSPSCVHKIEKLPNFFRLAELLSSRWKNRDTKRRSTEDERSKAPQGSASNRPWMLPTKSTDRSFDRQEMLITSWQETLQKLSVSSVELYPLVNLHLIRFLSVLNDQDVTSEHYDGAIYPFFGC